jgi:hypothetical protein
VEKYKKKEKEGSKRRSVKTHFPEKRTRSKRVSLPIFARDTVDRWIITLLFFELRARTPKASYPCSKNKGHNHIKKSWVRTTTLSDPCNSGVSCRIGGCPGWVGGAMQWLGA